MFTPGPTCFPLSSQGSQLKCYTLGEPPAPATSPNYWLSHYLTSPSIPSYCGEITRCLSIVKLKVWKGRGSLSCPPGAGALTHDLSPPGTLSREGLPTAEAPEVEGGFENGAAVCFQPRGAVQMSHRGGPCSDIRALAVPCLSLLLTKPSGKQPDTLAKVLFLFQLTNLCCLLLRTLTSSYLPLSKIMLYYFVIIVITLFMYFLCIFYPSCPLKVESGWKVCLLHQCDPNT